MSFSGTKSKSGRFYHGQTGYYGKNQALLAIADELIANQEEILVVNEKEVETAQRAGLKVALSSG